MTAPAAERRLPALLLILAGLFGAAGLVLMALGAHASSEPAHQRWLHEAGLVMLLHAPVILLSASAPDRLPACGRAGRWGLLLMIAGILLFAATLALRALLDLPRGHPLARLTPIGGGLAILGWLLVAAGGIGVLLRYPVDDQTRP